ncbi:MAG: MBL fold metallo-hydrolase [Chloroflexi bacterium]|nr:MAG: MBL fold metallo-hydrolase [Chloroflexota bacterium]MBL1194568.1 MBL fold metallo-hydrolase [Chloroflexota bacterium]NOH11857.1 MBL fold metallo-hydrolase [Chloroflexota bacterium]
MKKLEKNIYLEDQYPGVTLGALVLPQGTVMIDAPPRPDDGRAWLASLRGLGTSQDRLLVVLDAHPDRALGARAMESSVMAQDESISIFNQRTSIFKAQMQGSGSEWEECGGLSGIRWLPPNLTFDDHAVVRWGNEDIHLEHHPGPQPGAAWLVIPDRQLAFVGDAVLLKQPPFLEHADIPVWIDTLDILLKKPYKDYTLISSRGGAVPQAEVRNLRGFLKDIQTRMERLAKRKASPSETEKMVDKLLQKYKYPAKYRDKYAARLRHGIYYYYANHYHPVPQDS